MSSTFRVSAVVFGLSAGLAFGSPASAQSAAAKFGTRPPTTCPSVPAKKGPPPAASVRALVMCNYDHDSGQSITLMDDLNVQVGAPRRYSSSDALLTTDADAHAPEYPIRGSFTEVSCMRQFDWSSFKGKNCSITKVTEDHGLCWKTTFGDWRCGFGGRDLKQESPVRDQPPTPGTAAH